MKGERLGLDIRYFKHIIDYNNKISKKIEKSPIIRTNKKAIRITPRVIAAILRNFFQKDL